MGALTVITFTGRRRRQVVYGATRREAQLKLGELRRRYQRTLAPDKETQTVRQFVTRWLAHVEGRVRPRTHQTYKSYLENHVLPALEHKRLHSLRVRDVQALLDSCRDSMTPRAVQALRDILRAALNDAIRWGELDQNPAALAEPPRQTRVRVEAMTVAQAQALLKQVEGHRLEALYKVALAVGLRRSEICGLRWEDVDLKAKRLEVRRTLHRVKGKGLVEEEPKSESSKRHVALPPFAVKALREHRKRQKREARTAGSEWVDDPYVFVTEWGRRLDPDWLTHHFKGVAKAAKLPALNFHQLRHGAATLMLAQGVPLKIVQATLGHSTLGITADIYSHVAPELQRSAAAAMESALGGLATRVATPKGSLSDSKSGKPRK